MIEIKRAETPDERKRCYALRYIVFVEEQGVPVEMEVDDHDEHDAVHMMGVEDNAVVATARLFVENGLGKIGRVAVEKRSRGHGYGKLVISALMDHARKESVVSKLTLDAQVHATGLYEKLGFQKVGGVFDDAGIDHIKMVRDV